MRRVFVIVAVMIIIFSIYINFSGGPENVVIIDPGHGGEEPGAVGIINGQTVLEKDLNLKISLKVKNILESYNVPVLLTREKDESLSLEERVYMVKDKRACMFVSIHINANNSQNPSGMYAYYPKGTVLSDKMPAYIIGSNLNGLAIKYKGELPGNFTVLTRNSVPATLLELGFISNRDDIRLLVDEKFQASLAEKIAEGIILFRNNSKENIQT